MNKKKTIIIIDDHQILRRGLSMLINMEPDLNVCGEAESVQSGIDAISKEMPDIVLTDISLKDSDGIQLVKQLKTMHPDLPVLVVSMHDEFIYAERAIRAGARGYITKRAAEENIIEAIHHVLDGKIYLSESASDMVMQRIAGDKELDVPTLLSDREFEVFKLIGNGFRTSSISKELNLGVKTIETYQANIKNKLNLTNAEELTKHAIAWTKTHIEA